MPTENRSSNTEMVIHQDIFKGDNKSLVSSISSLLALDAKGSLVPHGIGGHARVLLASSAARLAEQPHPEPIAWMVGTAFWWTKEEAERDAAETGLPIVGLGPMTCAAPAEQHQGEPVALKCWSCKAGFTLKEREDCYGCCWECGVEIELDDYVGKLAGEVERLSRKAANADLSLAAQTRQVHTLRAQLSELKGAFNESQENVVKRGKMLAERDALLREADEFMYIMTGHDSHARIAHRYGEKWWDAIEKLRGKICTALSATAAPEAKL